MAERCSQSVSLKAGPPQGVGGGGPSRQKPGSLSESCSLSNKSVCSQRESARRHRGSRVFYADADKQSVRQTPAQQNSFQSGTSDDVKIPRGEG